MSAAPPSDSTRGSSPWEKPSTEAISSPNVSAFITASRQSKRGADPHGVVGQEAAAQRQGGQPYRDVHGEEPRPVGHGENSRRQRRPGHRRGGDDRGVDAHAASQPGLGVDEADQRGIDRGDGRGSEALHDARRHEGLERSGERTSHRSHREEHQPADVDLAVADQLAQRREGEQRDHDGQLVGVDDPDRVGRRDAQLLPDGGQCDVGDGPSITESETPNATARMAPSRRGMGSPSAGWREICGAAELFDIIKKVVTAPKGTKKPDGSKAESHAVRRIPAGFQTLSAGTNL